MNNKPRPIVDNFDVWCLWEMASNAWDFGPAGVAGLKMVDVRAIADGLDVEWTEDLLRRIRFLENKTLEKLHRNR